MLAAAVLLGAVAGMQTATPAVAAPPGTSAPVQHLVVIFEENASFDHYFGTYPDAANPPGEPAFHAAAGTPGAHGLDEQLLAHNPNAVNPQRLDRSQPLTCDNGGVDKFSSTLPTATPPATRAWSWSMTTAIP